MPENNDPPQTVTFDRKEFIDFLEWAGVKGEIATTDSGKESFNLEGCMGNTFTLDNIPSDPNVCTKCLYPDGGPCAQEDFCKGCGNFDAFFNSCRLTFYKVTSFGESDTIHPRTNPSRWLLAIVGCASDTRTKKAEVANDKRDSTY
jgi:hypothetical protein